jgi:hypothetical protein
LYSVASYSLPNVNCRGPIRSDNPIYYFILFSISSLCTSNVTNLVDINSHFCYHHKE